MTIWAKEAKNTTACLQRTGDRLSEIPHVLRKLSSRQQQSYIEFSPNAASPQTRRSSLLGGVAREELEGSRPACLMQSPTFSPERQALQHQPVLKGYGRPKQAQHVTRLPRGISHLQKLPLRIPQDMLLSSLNPGFFHKFFPQISEATAAFCTHPVAVCSTAHCCSQKRYLLPAPSLLYSLPAPGLV